MIILSFILLIAGTILGAFGAYFLKIAGDKIKNIAGYIFCPYFYLGGFLYFLAALLNVFYLKYLPYSIVLPMTSITYLWTLLISAFLLKEKLNKWNFIGIGLIFCGILILGTMVKNY
ncbi:MAG: EamA family transporter [Spirochaetales bacterium]|nr:EamA family transporter [Spirochaetales bacterium]